MFTKRIELFKLLGFPIKLDMSWLIVAVLVTWSLATGLFPKRSPGLGENTYWLMGVAGTLGLFVSILLHELGHAVVARHFDMQIRGITLFIFGGVAELASEPPSAKAEFNVAIAGPIVSVLLAAGFYGTYQLGAQYESVPAATTVVQHLSYFNAVVVAFNMVPAFPLDGGRVLRSILWHFQGSLRRATHVTASLGSGFGMFLIVLGVLWIVQGQFIAGLWMALIGMFLRGASQMSYQHVLVRRALEGEPVNRFMTTDVKTAPPDISLRDLVEGYVYRYHFKMLPVTEDSQLLGYVTTRRIKSIPHDEWDQTRVRDVLEPVDERITVPSGTDAMQAMSKMSQNQQSRLLVLDDGRLEGIITLKDMMQFIALKVELEEDTDVRPEQLHSVMDSEPRRLETR